MTSAVKGEGKTTTAVNLAATAAKSFGKKTLLLETDFKARMIRPESERGLGTVLQGDATLEAVSGNGLVPNLLVIPAGTGGGEISELLASEKMKEVLAAVRKGFEFVVLDCSPILPMFEMNVLSELVDGVLLVIHAGRTPRSAVQAAVKMITPERVIGVVFNCAEHRLASYYRYGYGSSV